MVDSAGGRSQLSQLTTAAVVLLVLLFLTGPLASLPMAVLAAIVFLIGIELIDIRGLRAILAVRRDEFLIALLTAVAVVVVGVEAAIVIAVVASIVDHLRTSYAPHNTVLQPDRRGHWRVEPASPHRRTEGGLVVYRFAATLYYANAHRLIEDVERFLADPKPPRWFCLDFAAIADVDYTAAAALRTVLRRLRQEGVEPAFSEVPDRVRKSLDRYGITDLIGADHIYADPEDVLAAYQRAAGLPRPPT
jgi:MFS superfamily sulfate permease-like transporter